MAVGFPRANQIGSRCQQITTGARNINLIINETVPPEIARQVLEVMGQDAKPAKLQLGVGESGAFTYTFA